MRLCRHAVAVKLMFKSKEYDNMAFALKLSSYLTKKPIKDISLTSMGGQSLHFSFTALIGLNDLAVSQWVSYISGSEFSLKKAKTPKYYCVKNCKTDFAFHLFPCKESTDPLSKNKKEVSVPANVASYTQQDSV